MIIEGIGGIGGVLAGRMIQAGHRPTLITGNPNITKAINSGGIRVKAPEGDFRVRAKALTSTDELSSDQRFDLALMIMKASSVVEASLDTLPFLGEHGYLVPCQNGIVEDKVAEAVGAERVVSGIVGWGGTMHAPGVYEKTGPGRIHIGELDGRRSERVVELAGVLRCVTPVVVSKNIRGALWSKLAINCTITTLGALTGETLGEMLKDRRVRRAFLAVYREVVDTAEALGIKLEKIAAHPKLLYMSGNAGPLMRFIKDLIARAVGKKYGRLKSSSLQSLHRGRKTEIDCLNGYVVEKAAQAGVRVPVNAALVRMVKEIEEKKRPISPDNLEELIGCLT